MAWRACGLPVALFLGLGGCARAGFGVEAVDGLVGREAKAGDARLDRAPTLRDALTDNGDLAPAASCPAQTSIVQIYAPDMVICRAEKSLVATQCEAEAAFCWLTGGWHMCTASEFLARGGRTTASTVAPAWLKGCIRDGGGVTSPSDKLCSCSNQQAVTEPFAWVCSSTDPVFTPNAAMGAYASKTCFRIGSDSPGTAAYWLASNTTSTLTAAVCCR